MARVPVHQGTPEARVVESVVHLLNSVQEVPRTKVEKKKKQLPIQVKKQEEEVSYQLQRFDPKVYQILKDFVGGQLSTEAYPYLGDAPRQQDATAVSLKSQTSESGWAAKAKNRVRNTLTTAYYRRVSLSTRRPTDRHAKPR
jgi:hypothetical protein